MDPNVLSGSQGRMTIRPVAGSRYWKRSSTSNGPVKPSVLATIALTAK